MKNLLLSLAVFVLGLSSSFAMYAPSAQLEQKVEQAGNLLLNIIEAKHDSNYVLMLELLSSFESRVQGNLRNEWILDTLISMTQMRMGMGDTVMMKDDMLKHDNMMDDTMMKDEMMDDHMQNDDMMMKDEMMGKGRVIDVSGVNYAFSQDTIAVQLGETITINFTSTDGFHDWVVDEFGAATEKVQTGGTTSVTFVADQAGSFEYYCSVGNHRAQGMVGTLNVIGGDEVMIDTVDTVALTHVAVGQTIRGITFNGSETGEAYMMTNNGNTQVKATFTNLPPVGSDNFYEGWIVRKSPLSVLSTGKVEMKVENGVWVNDWTIDSDISDHRHYVLTLEPNDNDPAPAEHVFEGDL